MKHVRALAAQPPLLREYNTNHPDEALRPADEAAAAWEAFKADRAAHAQLLDHLTRAQQGLCIYCEQRLVNAAGTLVPMDCQVEHVLPKSGAAGRVLDWQNLALACCGGTWPHHDDPSRRYQSKQNTSCGQTKDASVLPCDPRNLPLLDPLVQVAMDGTLEVDAACCTAAAVQQADVLRAIELLNLDCERLRKTRQDIGDDVRTAFVSLLLQIQAIPLTPLEQRHAIELFVAGRLQPDVRGNLLRFWSAERSGIGAPAESWLETSQALFV
ncbi:TIGR02646 family protein [Xylophilus rhododendri]|uniref:TIGR02646 family protein n=1 Tax=Xylophilus rhododendri TaxID=2697032 RepID=A0A857J1Z2_9BURK|nr:retron system putative HNH endonuclease [Xylophilus rhododendri]QHI97736.1 TIGR02646 family protein [Xylophilus rhododendri]